jgi:hypothetical protein
MHHPESHALPAAIFASSQVSEDHLSQIRDTLRGDLSALITPALEEQKKVNEHWEVRFGAVAEELRKMSIIGAGTDVEEDVTMNAAPQVTRLHSSFDFAGQDEDKGAVPFQTCA